jgi:BED zinc finger.
MSQSQASESQASFYAESFLDSDLPQPDAPFELPSSQPTVAFIPISDFTHPLRYSRAPPSLARIGPTLQRFWVLYNTDGAMEDSRKQFVDWWLTTEFGSRKELQTTIRWDGKKKSDVWERFDQVAHEKTGEPKVMCIQCHATIVHPNHHRAGSSPMKGHLTTSACRGTPRPTKRRIDQLLRDLVSLAYHNYSPYLLY